jgi:transposase
MSARDLYIGADLHTAETQLAVFNKEGDLLLEKRIRTDRLKKFVASLPGEKHVGMESVGFVYPIYDSLKDVCKDIRVANPRRIKQTAETKIKHDRVDARVLGDLLRSNYFPRSHIPDEKTREKRLLVMERVKYGVKGANLKTSIKWLLKRRGIRVKSVFTKQGRKSVRTLGLMELNRRLTELEMVESMIKELDAEIEKVVSNDRDAQIVDSLPGYAPYSALLVSSFIDDINRFPTPKHLCAYFGIVPSLHQSGDVSYTGHITKDGNKWVRRNLVECTKWAIRKDDRMKAFFLRIAHRRGKKKARLAVARKQMTYVWWMLKRQITYEELIPGSLAGPTNPEFE